MDNETRTIWQADAREFLIEAREGEGDGEGGTVTGYASVYYDGTPATEFDLKGIDGKVFAKERIMKGAFQRALAEGDDVRVLFNHDPSQILGRVSAGTAKLRSDKDGLRYEASVPDTTAAKDVMANIRAGNVTGSSFGFQVTDDAWSTDNGVKVRKIRGVRLFDVGPVTFPAYVGTSTEARSVGWDNWHRGLPMDGSIYTTTDCALGMEQPQLHDFKRAERVRELDLAMRESRR